jgi:hypothetical protein
LADALALLRSRGLDEVATVIDRRVRQKSPKMKLSRDQGLAVATYLVRRLPRMPRAGKLAGIMPHSTVELIRSIEERGVAPDEAERIAAYLARVVAHLRFARLEKFDINHSHVTGREWHEIDYSGEKMTWQGQKQYWSKKGVKSYKKAAYIHRYFAHAYELPHFARVYRPRGKWAGLAAP